MWITWKKESIRADNTGKNIIESYVDNFTSIVDNFF